MRALVTPGSSVARSEAERPLSGRSLTFLELTVPLTPDVPSCPLPAPSLTWDCRTIFATWFVPATMITVSFASANLGAETVISYVPGERLPMAKKPSSFAVVALVSPFSVFLMVICAFEMRAPMGLVILPDKVRSDTWACS